MSTHTVRLIATTTLLAACWTGAVHAQPTPTVAARLHGNAVASFQLARFPEAYGRFMALADAGHAPSAELALFMYQHGQTLFGNDWDVTQEQLTVWAALTGRPAPVLQARTYRRTLITTAHTSR